MWHREAGMTWSLQATMDWLGYCSPVHGLPQALWGHHAAPRSSVGRQILRSPAGHSRLLVQVTLEDSPVVAASPYPSPPLPFLRPLLHTPPKAALIPHNPTAPITAPLPCFPPSCLLSTWNSSVPSPVYRLPPSLHTCLASLILADCTSLVGSACRVAAADQEAPGHHASTAKGSMA